MATTKTKQSKPSNNSFRLISWLHFLPNIKLKTLIVGILIITLLGYAGLVSLRVVNDYICFDWPWTNSSQYQVNKLSLSIPDGWQRYYCHGESVTLKDKITSNQSKFALAMGWGGYEYFMSPGESGNIEINSGIKSNSFYKNKTLDEVFSAKEAQSLPDWVKQEAKKITVDGRQAIQTKKYYDPDPREKNRHGRYQYYNVIFFYEGDYWYELRLWGDWYKLQSRDAWVKKYEPVFDELVSSIKFK